MSNKVTQSERRAFLRRAGKISIGVPATAMILSVVHKRATAAPNGSKGNCGFGDGDDGTPAGKSFTGTIGCGLGGSRGE